MDRLVNWIADLMDSIGMRGSRLRWKWSQRHRSVGEGKAAVDMATRAVRGKHKMCPECRALIPKGASTCPECGERTSEVSGPGAGRALAGMFPGGVKVTSLILLVNGFWFILMAMRLIQQGDGGFGSILMFPGEFSESLVRFGALYSPLISGMGDLWRLIPPVFLHGGLMHFAFNSYVLIQIGPFVEEEYGRERFWVIYFGTGVLGYVATLIWKTLTAGGAFSLGASGAIMGLMGALIAYGIRRGGPAGKRIRGQILYYVGYIFLISLLFRGIDHAAHVGGLLSGFALGWVIPYGVLKSRGSKLFWDSAAVACVLAVVVAFYKIATQLL